MNLIIRLEKLKLNKNKGFTLVELLAVIVILAIILVITIPSISGIMENVKKNAFLSATKIIVDKVKLNESIDNTFDPTTVNETNLTDKLEITSNNYESIKIVKEGTNLYIIAIGKNQWEGLVASGYFGNVTLKQDANQVTASVFAISFDGEGSFTNTHVISDGYIVTGYGGAISTGDTTYEEGAIIAKYSKSGVLAWQKVLPISYTPSFPANIFFDTIEVSDGYVAVGINCELDAIIAKYSKSGTLEWQETFGGSIDDVFGYVYDVGDGYIVGGLSGSSDGDLAGIGRGGYDPIVVKYSYSGTFVWAKSIGGSAEEAPIYAIKENPGYISVGVSSSNNGDFDGLNKGDDDAYIQKVNSSGVSTVTKTFGGSNKDLFYKIIKVSDGYVAVGETHSNDGDVLGLNKGLGDGVIVKYNSDWSVAWVRTFGGSGYDTFAEVVSVSNGYIVKGLTNSNDGDVLGLNKGNDDNIFVKYDVNGNVIWKKTFGGSSDDGELPFSSGGPYFVDKMVQIEDMCIAIVNVGSYDGDLTGTLPAGALTHTNSYRIDLLVKINNDGEIVWKKPIYSGSDLLLNAYIMTQDNGGFLLASGDMYTGEITFSRYDQFGNNTAN